MEEQKKNDLFFVCSFIEFIARKTKNTKGQITKKMGIDLIRKIYDLADVYHSENIEKVAYDIIEQCDIVDGKYDVLGKTKNPNPPTFWDMGKVYHRLIIDLSKDETEYIDKLYEVFTSWIMEYFDNYNSSFYYENTDYQLYCYTKGKII